MNYYAGLDIGGTHARIKIEDEAGNTLGEFIDVGYSINSNELHKCREIYRNIVFNATSKCGLSPDNCIGICVAASGIDDERLRKSCYEIFLEMGFPAKSIIICNDCEVFLYTETGPSIILVAGTGSIAFGRSVKNNIVRCGGWGHLLSDEGSALDIAKKVFQAVGNHMDERISCPILVELFMKETGISDLLMLNHYLNEYMISDKSKIACYAKLAEKAAEMGDNTAHQILIDCADALLDLVRDIYKKIQMIPGTEITLWLWGSVLDKNRVINNRLRERAENEIPGLHAESPYLKAVEIALLVAKRNAQS